MLASCSLYWLIPNAFGTLAVLKMKVVSLHPPFKGECGLVACLAFVVSLIVQEIASPAILRDRNDGQVKMPLANNQ